MKNKLILRFIIASGMMAGVGSIYSQKECIGLYYTADQYLVHNLAHTAEAGKGKQMVNTSPLFDNKEIVISHDGKKCKHPKDSIYAIQYDNGSIVRIYRNSEYPVINPNETIQIYKLTSHRESKYGSSIITRYLFSKDAKSNIQELTLNNIKAAFPENRKFQGLIDAEFHTNEELAFYDGAGKMTKINHLLQNSLVEK
jgi:hypothetical protein